MTDFPTPATTFAGWAAIAAEDMARCEQVLEEWMDALNRHDGARMEACLRFPHVRLAANQVTVYDAPAATRWTCFSG